MVGELGHGDGKDHYISISGKIVGRTLLRIVALGHHCLMRWPHGDVVADRLI